MTETKKGFLIVLILMCTIAILQKIITKYYADKILSNIQVVPALITDARSTTYKPPKHTIEFKLIMPNGERLSTLNIYDYEKLRRDSLPNLVGKYLLAAVDSTNPEKHHQLLLTEGDFKTYGIAIPDSLMYLKTYERR